MIKISVLRDNLCGTVDIFFEITCSKVGRIDVSEPLLVLQVLS